MATRFTQKIFNWHKNAIILPGIIKNINPIWEKFCDLGVTRTFKAGELLFPNNELENKFLYIRKGLVGNNRIAQNGNEIMSMCIGEGTLCTDGCRLCNPYGRHLPYVRILRESEICIFKIDLLYDIISSNTEVMENMIFAQASKSISHNRLCNILGYQIPQQKLALFMIECCNCYHTNDIPTLIQKSELAWLLRMHKVSMSKAISELRQLGFIEEFNQKHLVVCNVDALASYADAYF